MPRVFAIVSNGVVVNVILADEWEGGIDVTDVSPRPSPGWAYENGVFSPPPPSEPIYITNVERAELLGRMTPIELHGWRRAAQRAMDSNTPAVADRNALYAWLRWESMQDTVDLTSNDIIALGQVWVALGMSQARAEELLTTLIVG